MAQWAEAVSPEPGNLQLISRIKWWMERIDSGATNK